MADDFKIYYTHNYVSLNEEMIINSLGSENVELADRQIPKQNEHGQYGKFNLKGLFDSGKLIFYNNPTAKINCLIISAKPQDIRFIKSTLEDKLPICFEEVTI